MWSLMCLIVNDDYACDDDDGDNDVDDNDDVDSDDDDSDDKDDDDFDVKLPIKGEPGRKLTLEHSSF